MIAAVRGDDSLARKLIEDDADPCTVSTKAKKNPGDHASALLLALQGFRTALSLSGSEGDNEREQYQRVLLLLFEAIGKADKGSAAEVINTGTLIRNESPFSVSIELGEPEYVARCIELGADLSQRVGGDDFDPLYLSLDTYYNKTVMKNRTSRTAGLHSLWKQNVNPLRMILPPHIIFGGDKIEQNPENLDEFQKAMKKAEESIYRQIPTDTKKVLEVVRLLTNPETVNKVCMNGRYPLDLAIETGDRKLLEVLHTAGARKRAIF